MQGTSLVVHSHLEPTTCYYLLVTGTLSESEGLRAAAMAYLDARPGPRVDYRWTSQFIYEGERIALMDRGRGIRKPRFLEAALAVTTAFTPPGRTPPYADVIGPDGLQRYKYQGADPERYDNVALRQAMRLRVPIIWFVGVADGLYEPIYPVWVIGEEQADRQFVFALDPVQRFITPGTDMDLATRRYVERTTKARLHQPVFRAKVMVAYGERCAVCSLGHRELLDAAHIIPDGSPGGDPVVPNGLSLCKIHHAAFDHRILGIRPDLTLHVRQDILSEVDGPMLRHGLQEMHNQGLRVIPQHRAARPDRLRLEERYAAFVAS